MARSVNFVWNYCNDTAIQHLDKHNKWISWFDLNYMTFGCSKELSIQSHTIQEIAREFVVRRSQYKKRKLSWRSKKRSLSWVPFRGEGIRVNGDVVIYNKIQFRFWKSREIEGKIKVGSFNQDSRGRWYVNFVCDEPIIGKVKDSRSVGIDLGLKTLATLSDGNKIERGSITQKYESKLATAQRARKNKLVRNIHAKIKNTRKDFNHKETTKLVNNYGTIFIGNVSSSKLKKTTMAKSVSDASWYDFKTMLAYKAITLGVDYKEVNESFSTVTCSTCFERTGPSGLSALRVREWTCTCGTSHDRDLNAAKNILRFGRETLIKGIHVEDVKKDPRIKKLTHERLQDCIR